LVHQRHMQKQLPLRPLQTKLEGSIVEGSINDTWTSRYGANGCNADLT